jgi:hypothetical protein
MISVRSRAKYAAFCRFNLLLGIFVTTVMPCAFAVLGGPEQSVAVDAVHMRGTTRVIRGDGYLVREIQAASGYVVREFVSPGGTVFAVAWEGPAGIDLQEILGSYFDQYKRAMAEARPRGNAPVSLQMPGFVFQLAGHMRSFHGQAYIPEMLPENFNFSSNSTTR